MRARLEGLDAHEIREPPHPILVRRRPRLCGASSVLGDPENGNSKQSPPVSRASRKSSTVSVLSDP
ncbi:MAG: hypothetical protein ACUVYA_16355 [Planctomycetota bacterium]